ncbi:hypothetical protein KGQ24_00610 [Patescibacteria group bacterium]|nr:hypothetical protein [Patescibacteria group bacterium]
MRMYRCLAAILAAVAGLLALSPATSSAQYIGNTSFISAGLENQRISPINGVVTAPTTTFMLDGQLMLGSYGDQLYVAFSSSQSSSSRDFMPQQGIAEDNLGSIGRAAFGIAPSWGNVSAKLGLTYTSISKPDASVVGMMTGNMPGAEAELSARLSPGDSDKRAQAGYASYAFIPFVRAEMYSIPQASGAHSTATYISAGLSSEMSYPMSGGLYGIGSRGGARWFARTSGTITHDPGAFGLDNGFVAMAAARSGFAFGSFEIGAQYQYSSPIFGGGLGVLNYAASAAGYNGLGSGLGYGYGSSYYGSQAIRPQAAGAAGLYVAVRF